MTLFGPISLGELIEALVQHPQKNPLYFDFGGFKPSGLASYRGYYDHLAVAFDENDGFSVNQLLTACQEANGVRFEGYKGGSYRMNMNTPVWADNYGHASGTAIVGVHDGGWRTILLTKLID